MKRLQLKSAHLYKWSDYYEKTINIINIIFKTQTKDTSEKAAGFGAYYEGVIDRTLQTLRKIWMQVLKRKRAWSQILSDYQPKRRKNASDGLRSPVIKREGFRIYSQLTSGTRYYGRNLSDKCRASSAQREVLGMKDEYSGLRRRSFLYTSGCNCSSQYASGFFGIKSNRN